MRILGLDPGLQHTGWGVIDSKANRLSFVACGVLKTDPKAPMAERLKSLHEQLNSVIEKYKPQTSAIEETFVNKNSASSLKLGQARGALMLTLALHDLPVTEYAANLVKKSVVGVGHAQKAQVAMMVHTLLPGARAETADAADALAVAICAGNHSSRQFAVSS